MSGKTTSWAVVATVSEPGPLVAAMAVHHISLGASEVHLYLDKPAPLVRSLLAGFPQVRIVACDDAYWRGKRPDLNTARQVVNANRAYRKTEAEWLLHCDADEFVSGAAPVAEALAAVPEGMDCARVANCERIAIVGHEPADLFEGPFRFAIRSHRPNELGTKIYGETNRYLNHGLTGHRIGKMFTRTGRDHRVLIHRAGVPDQGKTVELPFVDLPDHVLLHYDGLTPTHYLMKMLRHMDVESATDRPTWPASRVAQVLEARRLKSDGPALIRFIEGLRSVTPEQAELLRQNGLLHETGLTPIVAVRALCPEAEVDAAGFDAVLRQREKDLLQGTPVW